jgi:putative CocE/NonD family hydrolase
VNEASAGSLTIEFDVPAEMSDGTVLKANVFRPAGEGPWPTLLTRLPYGKDDPVIFSIFDSIEAARSGFMVVVQDTRGRFASAGEWEPFRFEESDGYDTVEWAATLPGSNGKVGMFGESYFGNTQWTAALAQPPSLAAISPALTWSEPMDGLFTRGGAVELGLTYPWTLEMGFDVLAKSQVGEEERVTRLDALIEDYDRLCERGYWDLPIDASPILSKHSSPELGGIRALDDPSVAEWCRIAGRYERVAVPTLHTGGWHDIFVQGTLDSYVEMARLGRDTRLIVGPWSHMGFADLIGQQSFGMRAGRFGVPTDAHGNAAELQLSWLRHQLDPDADIGLPENPVRIFVMGRNEWRDEPTWPLERAVTERHFLRGDRSLTRDRPRLDEAPAEYVYDPADPTPTRGGQIVMHPNFVQGPMDQTDIEAREDVLAFTSAPLSAELEVTGRVRVILNAESSARSTDWVARLCDVHPDGRSFNICDGIVRVAERANESSQYEIDLWSTSNVFLQGHRIRVQVTSSNFPRWDRNLNTGDQRSPQQVVARQRLYLDADRPSFIELPVVR